MRTVVLSAVLAGVFVTSATAQSVSPLRKEGTTLTDRKGFYINVGNPYDRTMVFDLAPMEADYATPATRVAVRPRVLRLAPGRSKRVTFMFEIQKDQKERKVALCVSPTNLEGAVLPRVCGTYTGVRLGQ